MKVFAPLATAFALLMGTTPALAQSESGDCPPYESKGKGPDLVLVPGLGSSPAVWDGISDRLTEDYRVHLVHIAGFAGRPANETADAILDESAAEIVRYLDCKDISSASYAGHSMGGFLGLKLAVEHPTRIDRLVVVDALPFYPLIFSPDATVETVQAQADAFRDQILAQSDATFEAGQRTAVRSLARDTRQHDAIVGWSLTSDRATFANAFHALMTTDYRPQLNAITAPTTVIAAANAFAPRSRVEPLFTTAYADLRGVEVRIVEESYHFIMFDQPEAFAEHVEEALAAPPTPN